LISFMVNVALASLLNTFSKIGISPSITLHLKKSKLANLRLTIETTCQFIKQVSRDVVEDNRVSVVESTSTIMSRMTNPIQKTTSKILTTVHEFEFQVKLFVRVNIISGIAEGVEGGQELFCQQSEQIITTSSKTAPYQEVTLKHFDLDLTFLLQNISESADGIVGQDKEQVSTPELNFKIDRSALKCKTPRRNEDVFAAEKFFKEAFQWAEQVKRYLISALHEAHTASRTQGHVSQPRLSDISADGVFSPVVPLLVKRSETAVQPSNDTAAVSTSRSSAVLDAASVGALLRAHLQSLEECTAKMAAQFPTRNIAVLLRGEEVALLVVVIHLQQLSAQGLQSVQFVESMLQRQLVAAIGRSLTARDFSDFMRFHNSKLFREQYRPKAFSYSIRRSPAHSPEGFIRIEGLEASNSYSRQSINSTVEPIETLTRVFRTDAADSEMQFAINASTSIRFRGPCHLHTHLAHSFSSNGSGSSNSSMRLLVQAKQFSSFAVVLGRVASARVFEPQHAFVVQNKDELTIPLNLQQIPTAQEFRDAVGALSPEQRALAEAFRAMQLQSTLFAVCVLQIKPHLEQVLQLPHDALTKEIRLTQQLMELFIEHQIPSDQLCFSPSLGSADPLNVVKSSANAISEMLAEAKAEQLANLQQKKHAQMAVKEHPDDDLVLYSVSESSLPRASARRMQMSSVDPTELRLYSVTPQSSVQNEVEAPQPEATWKVNPPSSGACDPMDFTQYPQLLEKQLELHGGGGAVRPTIINVGDFWTKQASPSLLLPPTTTYLDQDAQIREKTACFELLDALSKSGALVMDHAELHVIIAATHSFDKTLMDVAIQDNVNPIESVERTTLILAAAMHGLSSAKELVTAAQSERLNQQLTHLDGEQV